MVEALPAPLTDARDLIPAVRVPVREIQAVRAAPEAVAPTAAALPAAEAHTVVAVAVHTAAEVPTAVVAVAAAAVEEEADRFDLFV